MFLPMLSNLPLRLSFFFNGINCGPELYQWLAVEFGQTGISGPLHLLGLPKIYPEWWRLLRGVAIDKLTPAMYGKAPTASALPTLLKELEKLQSEGVLAGLLDLNSVILGGTFCWGGGWPLKMQIHNFSHLLSLLLPMVLIPQPLPS